MLTKKNHKLKSKIQQNKDHHHVWVIPSMIILKNQTTK